MDEAVQPTSTTGPAEFSAFFDQAFAPAFDEALERHSDAERAANSCVHGFASARRSWWWLGRTSRQSEYVHRRLNGRSGAKWLNEVDDSADAESLRSLVYVASTEVAGHRRRWVTLAGVGAAATVAIFVGGVLSTGEPEKLPADVVSADEKNEVVEDPPAEAETDTADEAEAPPLTIVLDPDAFRQQRESAE